MLMPVHRAAEEGNGKMTVEVGVSEAAALLGVSRDTIRRRIRAYRRGKALEAPILGARRDDRDRWLLELDREASLDPAAPSAAEVSDLVATLHDEVGDLRTRLDRATEAEREMRVLLLHRDDEIERLHGQMQRLLPATVGATVPAAASDTNQDRQPPVPRPRRAPLPFEPALRRWWDRLRS